MADNLYKCTVCGRICARFSDTCPKCGCILSCRVIRNDARAAAEKAQSIVEIESMVMRKISTGMIGPDRVLRGGFLEGSTNLLTAPPGTGKSTFALMAAMQSYVPTVYIAAEEASVMAVDRARRLRLKPREDFWIIHTTRWEEAMAAVRANKPRFVVVDSLQMLASIAVSGETGGPKQQEHMVKQMIELAEFTAVPHPHTFLIVSQVNKDGTFKGHNDIPHLVTAEFRMRRGNRLAGVIEFFAKKNRYGATNESAFFVFRRDGRLIEVEDVREEQRREAIGRYRSITGEPLVVDTDGQLVEEFAAGEPAADDGGASSLPVQPGRRGGGRGNGRGRRRGR